MTGWQQPQFASPFTHDLDIEVRYLWGHRRLFPELAMATEEVVEALGEPQWRIAWAAPMAPGGWVPVDEVIRGGDGPRYCLNVLGMQAAIDVAAGNVSADRTNFQPHVLVALFAARCFAGGERLRSRKHRRSILTEFVPLAVAPSLLREMTAMPIRDLHLAVTALASSTHSAFRNRPPTVEDIEWVLDGLCAAGLVETRRAAPRKMVVPAHQAMHPDFWPTTRKSTKHARTGLLFPVRSLADLYLSRPRARRAKQSPQVLSAKSITDVASEWRTQQAIALVMSAEPVRWWASASQFSFTGFAEYVPPSRFAGQLTSLADRSAQGFAHPAVRQTRRIADGALWSAYDRFDQPSVLFEDEGGRSHLRVLEHVHMAAALSDRWDKPVTLIITTTTESNRAVLRQCHDFITSYDLGVLLADFLRCNVDFRVVRHRHLRGGSPFEVRPELAEMIVGRQAGMT